MEKERKIFLTEWLKQIKFLFIAFCCPIALLWQWRKIILMEKVYMPLPFEEKAQPERACDASIFYFFFISFWGWFVCFLYPFIWGFYFILFFVLPRMFSYQLKQKRRRYLWKCLLSFFHFPLFLKCEITIFFSFLLLLFDKTSHLEILKIFIFSLYLCFIFQVFQEKHINF